VQALSKVSTATVNGDVSLLGLLWIIAFLLVLLSLQIQQAGPSREASLPVDVLAVSEPYCGLMYVSYVVT